MPRSPHCEDVRVGNWRRALGLAGLLAVVAGCSASSPPDRSPPPIPQGPEGFARCNQLRRGEIPAGASVVLIVSDAMRRDRTGAYGGPARTANFDAFARENLLFRTAVSQSPWTKPSIATLFTARLPSQHGVLDDPRLPQQAGGERGREASALSQEFETLAEVMRSSGFRTAAFVSNPWLDHSFGWAQGFETYDDSFAVWGASGEVVSRAAIEWLEALPPAERFFLYLHYIDGHFPYGAPSVEDVSGVRADARTMLPREQVRLLGNLELADGRYLLEAGVELSPAVVEVAYDRGLEGFDGALGFFLEAFRAHPAYERTALIVTSDHGEALWERGYGDHGHVLFDSLVAVPLAGRFPGLVAPQPEITCPVGLVDVMPTLCDYLELACPASSAGASWIAPAEDGGERRYLVSEGVMQQPRHRAIQNGRYKLHFEPNGRLGPRGLRDEAAAAVQPYSLYDLAQDPQERVDLLAQEDTAEHVDRVARVLIEALESSVADLAVPEAPVVPVDPEVQRRLEELGYTRKQADSRVGRRAASREASEGGTPLD